MQDYSPADFDELADWLLMISSDFSPSELDGAIVGGLSGGMRLSNMQWAQFGLAVAGADPATSRAEAILGGLAQLRLELLTSDDLSFQPYLPDDDEDIEQRTEALASWSKGFLGGFAEAQARSESPADRLPEAVEEALRDLMAIGQASLDSEMSVGEADEDYELGTSNDTFFVEDEEAATYSETDDERDYFEVVEYLKLAALTVFAEVGWVEMKQESQKKESRPEGDNAIENLFSRGDNTLH